MCVNYKTSLSEKSNPVRQFISYPTRRTIVYVVILASSSLRVVVRTSTSTSIIITTGEQSKPIFALVPSPTLIITCAANDIYVLLMNFSFSFRIARRSVIDQSWLATNLPRSTNSLLLTIGAEPSTTEFISELRFSINLSLVDQDSATGTEKTEHGDE